MANVLTTNPYKIDTAMTQSMKTAGGLPNNGPIYVTEVYWLNPASSGDTFVITDSNSTTFLTGRCESANQSQVFPLVPPRSISDFTVGTLASGTIYIYTL